jgi:flagellar assembly protein FliH
MSDSSSYIPREELPRVTRWQPDDFSPPPAPAVPLAASANTAADTAAADAPSPETETSAQQESAMQEKTFHLPTAEEIERIHEEAHAEGYKAGFAEGRAAAHAEGYQAGQAAAEARAEAFFSLSRDLQEALARLDQELAESVLACALEVARQMTHAAFRIQPELLLPIIREALAALPLRHEPVTLTVYPGQLALIEEALGDLFEKEGWRIEGDAEIAPGGCRIRAGHSEVDATRETRWRRVLEAIGLSPDWLERQP